MGWRLASAADRQETAFVKRFDPRFWTVNFPRPMMAAATTPAFDTLRVDTVFYRSDDLAGLIWEAEDRHDHPLLGYEPARDFRACVLSFRWRSGGMRALDAVNGPTLTIEGRDATGVPRAWYVRLWNYAVGTPADCRIALDFATLDGGFLLPGEADPVWAGDIDRMFVSLVPPTYGDPPAPLSAPAEAWLELSELSCDGPASVLAIGDAMVPAHDLRIATGYDDCYDQTPARVLRNMLHLGYRGISDHYVGMSHYFRLEWNAGAGKFLASVAGGTLNIACAAWHADFLTRARALGYAPILALSYELFDEHAWEDWKQRAANGDPAHTGYTPPSALLSPAHGGAMAYLRAVARAFVALAAGAGLAPRFQIGEPWWWVLPDGRPCLYDDAARAAFGGSPVAIPTVYAALTAPQTALLDAAGGLLAASTAALRDAARAEAAACVVSVLAYLPTVLDPRAPEIRRANLPTGWASPALDRLELEDYDTVTAGDTGGTARGLAAATARLGYPIAAQHYYAGFVNDPGATAQWALIDAAAEASRARGAAATFVWALPQVIRDGFVHFGTGGDSVDAFDDVDFPLALGRAASVAPVFSTAIVTTASGAEQRNADWADARLSFDAGPGVRSEADLGTLIAFFRARRGAAKAFRLRDPFDHSTAGMSGAPGFGDAAIGTGDGIATRFELMKLYGAGAPAQRRRLTRPVSGSVRVGVGGVERASGWSLLAGGVILFDTAPAAGAVVTAGCLFDVPVRFAEDRLEVNAATFAAGEAPSVPLIEVREG